MKRWPGFSIPRRYSGYPGGRHEQEAIKTTWPFLLVLPAEAPQ